MALASVTIISVQAAVLFRIVLGLMMTSRPPHLIRSTAMRKSLLRMRGVTSKLRVRVGVETAVVGI